jgi:mRNA degradation ribonuclease J1/J2
VDLFLVDSTNAEVPGFSSPRASSTPAIEKVFRTAPRRVIVSSFASHVHRIQQVLDAAAPPRPQGRLRRALDGPQHGIAATSAT